MTAASSPATIYARAYLAAYDLQRSKLYNRHRTAFLVRAGVLADLARQHRAREVNGRVEVAADDESPDPVIAAVASEVGKHRRGWRSWIRHRYKRTLDRVEAHLLEEGVLVRQHGKPVVADPGSITEFQESVRAILTGEGPVAGIDPGSAAVAVLAAVEHVPLVPAGYRLRHRARYSALAARAGELSPGIEQALRELKRTTVAARGGMG